MTRPICHWAATHPGAVRTSNQDAYLCRPDIGLFAVADGVGGQAGGAYASAEVVRVLDTVPQGLSAARLLVAVRSLLQDAHQRLLDSAGTPATTIVVLLLQDDHVACLWAGDSRAYVLRRGILHRLTSDHSLVQEMVRAGVLTASEAELHPRSNVITRAIGVGAEGPLVEKAIGFAEPGDRFLLCSDGLTRTLDEAEIVRRLHDKEPARSLVEGALAKSARDNVTALVLTSTE